MKKTYTDFIAASLRPDRYGRKPKLEDLFPRLGANNQVPLSIKQCLEWRLERGNKLLRKIPRKLRKYKFQYEKLQEDYRMWPDLFTGDAIAYHPEGRIKIIYDCEKLRKAHSPEDFILCKPWPHVSDNWKWKYLRLTEEKYHALHGPEFFRKDIDAFIDHEFTKVEEVVNPVLLALVRQDKNLLQRYAHLVFSIPSFTDGMYGNKKERMYVQTANPQEFVLSPWVIEGVANHNSRLRGDLGYSLHYGYGSCQSLLLGKKL